MIFTWSPKNSKNKYFKQNSLATTHHHFTACSSANYWYKQVTRASAIWNNWFYSLMAYTRKKIDNHWVLKLLICYRTLMAVASVQWNNASLYSLMTNISLLTQMLIYNLKNHNCFILLAFSPTFSKINLEGKEMRLYFILH